MYTGVSHYLSIPLPLSLFSISLLSLAICFMIRQRYHAMEEVLEYFKNGIDEQQAKSNGYVIPLPGSNPAYDSCQDKINEIEEELEGYLKIQQAYFGNNTNVKYMHKNNEPYQIEVPKYIISKRAQPCKYCLSPLHHCM